MMPTQTVDWTTDIRERRGNSTPRVFRVTCGACGYTRMLIRADAKKAERTGGCFQCAQKAKAKQGFAAMAGRFGHRWAMRHVQAYREANPTRPELDMADLLADLGVYFRREVELSTKAHGRKKWTCLLDFVVYHDGREFVIEVDGEHWHSMPGRAQLDRRKNRLLKRRHIPLLRVTDADVKSGRGEPMVIEFLHLAVAADDPLSGDVLMHPDLMLLAAV